MSSAVQADDEYELLKDCMGTKSSWWRLQVDDNGHKYCDVEGHMREISKTAANDPSGGHGGSSPVVN